MKKWITLIAFFTVSMGAVNAQNTLNEDVTGFLGKQVTEPGIAAFVAKLNIDGQTGISYENGIQLFKDGEIFYEVYLFNATTLNGQAMQTYKGLLPFGLTFKETPESITKKVGSAPEAFGEHLVWISKGQRLEVAFKDEKRTEISFISVSTL